MTHTKGKWEVLERSLVGIRGDENEENISIAGVYGNNESELNANAKLIAAAPDMLDLLIRIEKNGVGNVTMGEIRSTIQKATA